MHTPRFFPLPVLRLLAVFTTLLSIATTPATALTDNRAPILLRPHMGSIMEIAHSGRVANVYVDPADWPGVIRAANDLRTDIARVTNLTPPLTHDAANPGGPVIIIGTIGRSALVDQLIAQGKIDVSRIRGRWEAFLVQGLANALPNGSGALVIVGSDKRGTIFGTYDVCEAIGVSPWHWWADVVPETQDTISVMESASVHAGPSVKYRGIFINDEAPALTNWVRAKYGPAARSTNPPVPAGVANYGREFYARVFELLLRMKANYLWPAMWNNAFNEDDPENARLADDYGIVMGTSHQEPMLRAQKEWDRRYAATLGSWNYGQHPTVLQDFWREGVHRNRAYESIYTMGLRGADDTEMAPGGPAANRALLEQIVDVQRGILRDEVNPDLTRVPQVWCLYKEVQDYYEDGMRVPDDVTLLWAEDNWGNVRRLPSAAERNRSGGAGIYYHFDYHGGPRSYQWMNTTQLPKIWDQMSLAKQYGADRIWIVNVGHLAKSYELPIEYFLSLAWDTTYWTSENTDVFTRAWAAREFGPGHSEQIADILARAAKYNARRKPELLSPSTYSLTDYNEADTVVADYHAIARQAEEIFNALPAAKRDAFYQMVLFPVKSCAIVNELYVTAGKNALYARQGRASTNAMAASVRELFQQDMALKNHFNTEFAGGRWAHMMDQTHLGYTSWNDPATDNLNAIPLTELTLSATAALGVAIEGSTSAWPVAASTPALPKFDVFAQQTRWIDVFNKGTQAFAFTAAPSAPWILLNETSGTVTTDRRLSVQIDWAAVPAGTTAGTIRIAGAGTEVTVALTAFKPAELDRATAAGFVESNGVVSIEAENVLANHASGERQWLRIADYGHTLSGMRATAPVDSPAAVPGTDTPCLEYQIHTFTSGPVNVHTIVAPTLNFQENRPLRYAVSFDDAPPQIVTLVPADYKAQNGNTDWERSVSDNSRTSITAHTLAQAGAHRLKIWMIDPGVVVQKLVVDLGGLKPSYLRPPQSYSAPSTVAITAQPIPQNVRAGAALTLSVTPAGLPPFTYQWKKNGVDIAGATSATFTIPQFTAADVGTYRVVITNAIGSITSDPAGVGLATTRVMNISVRGPVGTGDQTLIMGFVLTGEGSKSVLLRNIGPTLASLGVTQPLANPELELFRENTRIAHNDDWATAASVSSTLFARLGAGALPSGSRDSALLASLTAGSYSAHGRGMGGTTGIAVVEAFDADVNENGVSFANFSVRNQVGTGEDVLIVGFVVEGNTHQRFLIRGLGPALASHNVAGVLLDPQLSVHNRSGETVAANDDWSSAELTPVFTQLGAGALAAGSHDAALVLDVAPGLYTAQVRGANATTGVGMVEVFAMP